MTDKPTQSTAQCAPSADEIEAAAKELWLRGNKRIGYREWDAVAADYLAEAEAALRAAADAARGAVPTPATREDRNG